MLLRRGPLLFSSTLTLKITSISRTQHSTDMCVCTHNCLKPFGTAWYCVSCLDSVCPPHSGTSGFRRPLHPWIPLLQPYPVPSNSVIWPPQNPSPDYHRQHGFSSSTVRPPAHTQVNSCAMWKLETHQFLACLSLYPL